MKCNFPACNNDAVSKGYCRGHYQQHWNGVTMKPLREKKMLHVDDEGRVCTTCEKYKVWSEFYKHSDGQNYRAKCKACIKEQTRANRLANAPA